MTDDELIGRNVAALRGEHWSQKAVADAMRQRGHRWSQATVWSVEKGERPLRLSEARTLCDVLGAQLWAFMKTPKETAVVRESDAIQVAAAQIAEGVYQFRFAKDGLLLALDEPGDVHDEHTLQRAAEAEALELESVIQAGDEYWEKISSGEQASKPFVLGWFGAPRTPRDN